MPREIKEIEDLLTLCIDMDSPSMVIPVSTIEKHFPAHRLPHYPDTPCYNLGRLRKWAKAKGWEVKLASTGSKEDLRILPAIRFVPLGKINPVPNTTTNPPSNSSDTKHDWHNKPLGKIAIGTIVVIMGAAVIWIINHYLSVNLQNIK